MGELHLLWDARKQSEGFESAIAEANKKREEGDNISATCIIASAYYSRASFLGRRPARLLLPWNFVVFVWCFFRAKHFAWEAYWWIRDSATIGQYDVVATVLMRNLLGLFGNRTRALHIANNGMIAHFPSMEDKENVEFALLCLTFIEACPSNPCINVFVSREQALEYAFDVAMKRVPRDAQEQSQLSRVQRRTAIILQRLGGSENHSTAHQLLDRAHENARSAGATSQL